MNYVKEAGSGSYEEKKSRFLGAVFPISCREDAQERIMEQRKCHYEARHHCYAYILGEKGEEQRQSDDGEPSQTAGLPILKVLCGAELTDSLLVVSRYFGGTLLGTGGLVRAYTEAAKAALSGAVIVGGVDGFRVRTELPYSLLGKLRFLAESMEIREESAEYGEGIKLSWLVPKERLPLFSDRLRDLSGASLSLAIEKTRWYNP